MIYEGEEKLKDRRKTDFQKGLRRSVTVYILLWDMAGARVHL